MTMPLTPTRFLLLALLAALLATAVFSPGLGGGFVLDDAHTIVSNPLIQLETLDRESLLYAAGSFHAGSSTRPLAMLTFGLDYWRHGSLDAPAFKFTNLIIHGLTTLLLALLLRRLLELAQWPPRRVAICALAVALVWAVHPLQVSSVLYVVQRMQTLATLFLVLAMWAYLGLRRAQIEGRPGWPHGVLAAGCWLLAVASKEDAILLPLYLLVLELTILRFRAASPARSRGLRNTFVGVAAAGAAVFLLWMLPHYWSHDAYPGRDFNSIERLLTQTRVLLLYLWQILWPWPGNMPFNYDHLAISRGLLQPISTILALPVLIALLAWAWLWRTRRPVFACGVFLFFAGHVLTSNVIGLEMVFEHRNHLPLIGALLAVADLVVAAWQRWSRTPRAGMVAVATIILAVSATGMLRAWHWGDPIRFALYGVEVAPDSPRAWLNLGGAWFDLAGRRAGKDSPHLEKAIAAVEQGAARTGSASAYANIVIYKTIQGTVTNGDWDRLLQRLHEVPMLPHNKNIMWTTLANVRAQIGLDEERVLALIDVVTRRADFRPADYLRLGVSIYTTMEPESALPYFLRAAEGLPQGDSSIVQLCMDLVKQGQGDWAQAIERANTTTHREAPP